MALNLDSMTSAELTELLESKLNQIAGPFLPKELSEIILALIKQEIFDHWVREQR